MPFINDRLQQNEEAAARASYQSAPRRASRFTFDPASVMAHLRARIVGQSAALAAMDDMLVRIRADIAPADKPLSVHLFLGPTGVGKTETVRLIAEAIHGRPDALCRIDMNTLAQEHYAAALTGAPPGYVGSKEGHTLFEEEAIKGSFSTPGIVLFDELEKASPEVIRTLLNVLDNGRMVFPSGNREIDFRNAMVFMTSNLGAREIARYRASFKAGWRKWLGLGPSQPQEARILDQVLHQTFVPEFINRIDRIITYERLAEDRLPDLLAIELKKLNQRLAKRQVQLSLTPQLANWLCQYDDTRFGARDLARRLRRELEPPLARAMLKFGDTARFEAGHGEGEVFVRPMLDR